MTLAISKALNSSLFEHSLNSSSSKREGKTAMTMPTIRESSGK